MAAPLEGVDPADLRRLALFDGLSDEQVAALADAGAIVAVEPGVVLFGEGEAAEAWWVLLDGTIALVRRIGREDTVVAQMDVPGRWAGGFRAWDENGTYLATGRGAEGPVRRVVPLRRPPDRRPLPHGPLDRVDRASAQLADHPRHPGRRTGARAQQPGVGGHPRRRRPGRGEPRGDRRPRPAVAARHHRRPVRRAGRA